MRLRFSFVGMKTKDVPYKKNQPALVVVLEEEAESIGEIVVTGYQQIEKRNLTSSVVTVKTSELKTIGASSIEPDVARCGSGAFRGEYIRGSGCGS